MATTAIIIAGVLALLLLRISPSKMIVIPKNASGSIMQL